MGSYIFSNDSAVVNDLPGLHCTLAASAWRSFASANGAARVSRVVRHATRDLLGGRVVLTPKEGKGYCEFTQVQNELLVVVSHVTYQTPQVEPIPSDGLVRFDFKLSGEPSYRVSRSAPTNNRSLRVLREPPSMPRQRSEPSSPERRVTISVRPTFLREHLLPYRGEVHDLLQGFVSVNDDGGSDCQLSLTEPIMDIVTKLIDNRRHGT